MPYPTTTLGKMEHNSRLKCSVEHCMEHRWRFSGLCQRHNQCNQLWGHPEGRLVKDSDLTYHWDLIERVLEANPEHKGVRSAIEWFEKAMKQGHICRNSMEPPYLIQPARQWARMYKQQVSPRDCLVAAASVWALGAYCFPYKSKTSLIKSDKHMRYVLGHKVVKLTTFWKGERYVTGKERRQMAETIIKGIGPLLVSLADTVERLEKHQREHLCDLQAELVVPN